MCHRVYVIARLLAWIFQPSLTTSDVGKARRFGLAVCHSIVTSQGGIITAESDVARGSTFRVELPAAPAEACRPRISPSQLHAGDRTRVPPQSST
jgi:nitrogen-specific signal transduction histidine kinase